MSERREVLAEAGHPPCRRYHNRGAVLAVPGLDFRRASWTFDATNDDVAVRVELCGLCGTDVHAAHGETSRASFPLLLGHEIVGTLAAHPPGLTDLTGRLLRGGDRVVLGSASFGECQRCYHCTVLYAPWLCSHRDASLLRIDEMDVTVVGGGLARYVRLPASRHSRLLRADVAPAAGVLHEPLSVAVRTVLGGPSILGQDVVVQGTGAIGLLTILVARIAGAARIVAVGGPPSRLDRAVRLGATDRIDIGELTSSVERIDAVRRATFAGLGAAVVYEAAGVPEAVTEGLGYLRPSGVLLEAGNAAETGTTTLNPHCDIQAGRRAVIGVRGVRTEDFVIAMRLLEQREEEIATLVTHRLPLDRVADGIGAMQAPYRLDGRDVIKIAIDPFAENVGRGAPPGEGTGRGR